MKKFIHCTLLVCSILISHALFANTIIVKGYVRDSAGAAIANKYVRIYTDSTNQGCILYHTKVTNPNGYYIDTLTCTGDIRKIRVTVENCNGALVVNEPALTTTGIIESNFKICTAAPNPPAPCKAYFTYTTIPGTTPGTIKFNSTVSVASGSSGDSIISRTWYFGDSSTLTGNSADPSHTYQKPGTYYVYLIIKTKTGCESKYAASITVPPVNNCTVQVAVTTEKLSARKFRFNSKQFSIPQGDSIIQRNWKFGDGTLLNGNEISPLKEYKDTGYYTVCLSVKTAGGCEKEFCASLRVYDSIPPVVPPTGCKAVFTFSTLPTTSGAAGLFKFNSAASVASTVAGDSIISRTWYFGDSSYLTGNTVDPSHNYQRPGSYTVYLLIKTKKGCESKYSAIINITTAPACAIQLYFSTEKIGYKKFRFNSSQFSLQQGDTIVQRNWKFGDGTLLNGNEISPAKEYKDTGLYTVCLSVKTARGCEKEFCASLHVYDTLPAPVIPTGCKALFTYTIVPGAATAVQFNSAASVPSSVMGDSIISRTWFFGDSAVKSNDVSPLRTYTKPGTYYVYLVIKTKKGCESRYYTSITIPPVPVCQVQVQFGAEKTSARRIQFYSELYPALRGDSIIQRKWSFGDGTYASGNEARPVKTYLSKGAYTVCLSVKTAKGCEGSICRQVVIEDSIPLPANTGSVKIISINPNPVTTRLVATVWSRTNNAPAEIAIYDIYGVLKSVLRRTLNEGNNIIEVVTDALYKGPYFLRVSTPTGKDSRIFYKF